MSIDITVPAMPLPIPSTFVGNEADQFVLWTPQDQVPWSFKTGRIAPKLSQEEAKMLSSKNIDPSTFGPLAAKVEALYTEDRRVMNKDRRKTVNKTIEGLLGKGTTNWTQIRSIVGYNILREAGDNPFFHEGFAPVWDEYIEEVKYLLDNFPSSGEINAFVEGYMALHEYRNNLYNLLTVKEKEKEKDSSEEDEDDKSKKPRADGLGPIMNPRGAILLHWVLRQKGREKRPTWSGPNWGAILVMGGGRGPISRRMTIGMKRAPGVLPQNLRVLKEIFGSCTGDLFPGFAEEEAKWGSSGGTRAERFQQNRQKFMEGLTGGVPSYNPFGTSTATAPAPAPAPASSSRLEHLMETLIAKVSSPEPAKQASPAFAAYKAAKALQAQGFDPKFDDLEGWASMEDVLEWAAEQGQPFSLKALKAALEG